ncbi:MAG: APC family permease [Planctomycetota bacterium]|jgi:amino acid transporter
MRTSVRAIALRFGLWDAVSIVVGIVIGTTIFRSPTIVFQNSGGPWQALAIWLLGGVLCYFGALCYAELATTYPRNGGDYEYLGRAFGRPTGFLFAWAQLSIVLTGSIGAMAYAFADYGARLWGLPAESVTWMACAAIVGLSALNLAGIVVGKAAQNLLSAAKVLGLTGVVLAGLIWGRSGSFDAAPASTGSAGTGMGLALVFVLYGYGGWNNAVFVAAEIRDQQRNLPRAMFLGLVIVTAVYLAVNAAYLAVLGFETARQSVTPAADVFERAVGPWGVKAISLLVMVSALGAINGTILTGSRVAAAVGEDHHVFRWLGRWNKRAVPSAAVIAQGGISLLLAVVVGTESGRNAMDGALASVGLATVPWERYFGGFEALVAGSAPVFWAFFLLTGLALFVLRRKEPDRARPFSTPWFPLPALVFCATCAYMLYSSLEYARWLTLLGVAPLVLGVPLYWFSERHR